MVSFSKSTISHCKEIHEGRFSLDMRHFLSFLELQVAIPTDHSTSNQRLSHGAHFGAKKCDLGSENTYFWDVSPL